MSRPSSPRSRAWPRRPRAPRCTSSACTSTGRSGMACASRRRSPCSPSTIPARGSRGAARGPGLAAGPPSNRPPVNVVRFAFQTMVGIGTMLAILGILTVVVRVRRRRLPSQRAYYAAVAAAGPLSVVALVAGWVTTEVGRQPWVVYGVMRTTDAVTGAGVIPVSYAGLWALYVAVGAAAVWILRRLARMPVETPAPPGTPPGLR